MKAKKTTITKRFDGLQHINIKNVYDYYWETIPDGAITDDYSPIITCPFDRAMFTYYDAGRTIEATAMTVDLEDDIINELRDHEDFTKYIRNAPEATGATIISLRMLAYRSSITAGVAILLTNDQGERPGDKRAEPGSGREGSFL